MVTSRKLHRVQGATARVKKRYSSDLTNAEWQILQPLLPLPKARGRKRQVDEREILNGIFYQIRNGCVWSDLPKDLPAWQSVYKYFRQWQRKGIGQQIHDALRPEVRVSVGK